jgi:ATP-dependent RNA helicase SUPV3L1/SUV3
MVNHTPASPRRSSDSRVKAVLGPTNTGKTHLAIERLCAHSSGAIGFPLRLLAREVYDRVVAIKGENRVALITGEERIEPPDARWLLCTAESMPVVGKDMAFVALDEAQLSADRERGHIFTDRLLNARGREETMILGSAALEPMIKALVPEAEVVNRPRFSTLRHAGAAKLSRIPPRSAIVAFSAEQVYAIAEMLRRFRGGAAVVMGALSPQTRNAQVALYQSGEVDYIVATDAIGMGLNLDIGHVAFAGLSKFDGVRQRRLTTSEMAQIAGRAGRHQRDGTFGSLSGTGGHDSAFADEEVYAIEEHRFPPITRLYWREAEPRCDSLDLLIADLEAPPSLPQLTCAPEAIDLAVLRRLAEDPEITAGVRTPALVARFWQVCSLPDFRHQGVETHSRFIARLWQDLRHDHLGADYVAQAIAMLDNPAGDIDTLQGRIASIRSWSYIAQRPDWVMARDEMAARARSVEARLSDALHARLTERFVNRRTAVLMKKTGPDAAMLPVRLEGETVLVDGEAIGALAGFRFKVDPTARHGDRKLLLAAADRHVPALVAARAAELVAAIRASESQLHLADGAIVWQDEVLAILQRGRGPLTPRLTADIAVEALPVQARDSLLLAMADWLDQALAPLEPLRKLDAACTSSAAGPALRALLIRLVEAGGMMERRTSGIDQLDPQQRGMLAKLGVKVGALDMFVPGMLKPKALSLWRMLAALLGQQLAAPDPAMPPVLARSNRAAPPGYRQLGKQLLRLDIAEKLLREAHAIRVSAGRKLFMLDPAKAVSAGLTTAAYARLLQLGGFNPVIPRALKEGAFGPPAPLLWRWRPMRVQATRESPPQPAPSGAFAALAELVR